MNQKHILTVLCIALSINFTISASTRSSAVSDPLKKILSFINEQTNQTSPVFDYSAKPRFEAVDAAIDSIIEKAEQDKWLAENENNEDATNKQSDTITKAREFQRTLRARNKSYPNEFLSDADLQKSNLKTLALPIIQEKVFPNEQQMVEEPTNSPFADYARSEDFEPSEQNSSDEENVNDEFYYDYLSE